MDERSPIENVEHYLAQQLLSPGGYAQYQHGDVSKSELSKIVTEIQGISQAYVTHSVGSKLSSPIERVSSAEAYALYYTPINAAKILHLLPLLRFKKDEIRVLDVGSGPGTAGLALLAGCEKKIHLTCIEHSSAMRQVAERLLSQWKGQGTLGSLEMRGSLPAEGNAEYDLIVAANVLAELDLAAAEKLVTKLASSLSDGGYLLLLEPGQQPHTRRLMTLRDKIVSEYSSLVPLFPCLRSDACPMLVSSETYWCHGSIEWRQPKLNAQLDDLLSFNKHRIKYSAFLFQKGGTLALGVRVITEPVKERDGIKAIVCGKDLYGVVRIRKGCRSEHNRPLEKASVFDRLILSPHCAGDIGEDAVVSRPASFETQ